MSNRPGGMISRRPLNFIWIVDCSGSMALDGKVQALNSAIRSALPHMLDVQHDNPQAAVMIQTLRFSSGARWIQGEPVSLESFQWTDLQADELPQTAAFASEFRNRLLREGAQTGDVQISLIWNNFNDLDLHVICPSGEKIYFGHKKSGCGGELDVDMNVSPTSVEPVENVYWPVGGAPVGRYQVFVNHYKNHRQPGCQDPTRFRVAIKYQGNVEEVSGSISYGSSPQLVKSFEVVSQTAAIPAGITGGGNTDMGAALTTVADALRIPPMTNRALPPVLVLISDGQPTDDLDAGIRALMAQPWGKKSVRVAIAIGRDADEDALQKFIGHSELRPLAAHNAEALVGYIRWASTAVLSTVSRPASQVDLGQPVNSPVPIPTPPTGHEISPADPW